MDCDAADVRGLHRGGLSHCPAKVILGANHHKWRYRKFKSSQHRNLVASAPALQDIADMGLFFKCVYILSLFESTFHFNRPHRY